MDRTDTATEPAAVEAGSRDGRGGRDPPGAAQEPRAATRQRRAASPGRRARGQGDAAPARRRGGRSTPAAREPGEPTADAATPPSTKPTTAATPADRPEAAAEAAGTPGDATQEPVGRPADAPVATPRRRHGPQPARQPADRPRRRRRPPRTADRGASDAGEHRGASGVDAPRRRRRGAAAAAGAATAAATASATRPLTTGEPTTVTRRPRPRPDPARRRAPRTPPDRTDSGAEAAVAAAGRSGGSRSRRTAGAEPAAPTRRAAADAAPRTQVAGGAASPRAAPRGASARAARATGRDGAPPSRAVPIPAAGHRQADGHHRARRARPDRGARGGRARPALRDPHRARTSMVGNVYLGRVQNVLPGMEAAFVDVGRGRNGVLYAGEVNYSPRTSRARAPRIEQLLKPARPCMVQVTKDPMGGKGARLTAQPQPRRAATSCSRPNQNLQGISRRLGDDARKRLKTLLKRVKPPEHGVIVRTAAEGATEEALEADLRRLLRDLGRHPEAGEEGQGARRPLRGARAHRARRARPVHRRGVPRARHRLASASTTRSWAT